MFPDNGYRLYQAQRPRTRAEIIADDARLGRQAAAIARGGRELADAATAPVTRAAGALRALAARLTARPA
jgi:hypothetical protein